MPSKWLLLIWASPSAYDRGETPINTIACRSWQTAREYARQHVGQYRLVGVYRWVPAWRKYGICDLARYPSMKQ